MKRYLSIIVAVCIILLIPGLFTNVLPGRQPVYNKATKGVLDLSEWNPGTQGVGSLDGQWELYWGKLLEPGAFSNGVAMAGKSYLQLPGSLASITNNLPKHGFGTIRLKIILAKESRDNRYRALGIRTEYILSASKIWINGVLVSKAGIVGTEPEFTKGSYERQLAFFYPTGNEIEIVIQMANFNNITGKVKRIYLGNSDQIKRDYTKKAAQDAFIIGCLFIMGVYHVILFLKRPNTKALVYFGGFCLMMALRDVVVSQRLIFEFLPNIPFGLFNKLAYLTLYLAVPFLLLFLHQVIHDQIHFSVVKGMGILSLVLSIATIFLPVESYDRFLLFYEIALLLVVVYVCIIIAKAALNRNRSAGIILVGFGVLLLTAMNDMLIQAGLLYSTSLAPTGLLVFVFLQSYMLASEFSKAYSDIEMLMEQNKAMFIDDLTGILNRKGFFEYAGRLVDDSQRKEIPFLILFGDLNKFKRINDTYGHKEGDLALQVAARLIRDSFEEDDIVARMSGDEFIIIAKDKSMKDADAMVKRIKNSFARYNSSSEKAYHLLIDIGYAAFKPNTDVTLDDLIHEADSMLYRQKNQN